jgi:hypothetical protein
LYLYYFSYYDNNPVGRTYWAYKLSRTDWVESEATWNIYKTGSNWTTAGGDYVTSSPAGGSKVMPASFGWVSWDILAIVQDAQTNGIAVELLLKDGTESGDALGEFHSKEYTSDTSLRPKLVIEYTLPQTIAPSSISQPVAYGTPTVLTSALSIQPSSIVQQVVIGTPALRYPQSISPSSIIVTIAYGTPSVGIFGIIKPESTVQQIVIGSPTILKYVWHVILDGQYLTETPETNRSFVIGRDQYGNPVYGTAVDSTELALVGERLDFQQELAVPTEALAEDMAEAVLVKMRLTGNRGVIFIPPNCGQELFDVVQISDSGANQSAVKFRVVGLRFEYNPKQARYQHKLILGAP